MVPKRKTNSALQPVPQIGTFVSFTRGDLHQFLAGEGGFRKNSLAKVQGCAGKYAPLNNKIVIIMSRSKSPGWFNVKLDGETLLIEDKYLVLQSSGSSAVSSPASTSAALSAPTRVLQNIAGVLHRFVSGICYYCSMLLSCHRLYATWYNVYVCYIMCMLLMPCRESFFSRPVSCSLCLSCSFAAT